MKLKQKQKSNSLHPLCLKTPATTTAGEKRNRKKKEWPPSTRGRHRKTSFILRGLRIVKNSLHVRRLGRNRAYPKQPSPCRWVVGRPILRPLSRGDSADASTLTPPLPSPRPPSSSFNTEDNSLAAFLLFSFTRASFHRS